MKKVKNSISKIIKILNKEEMRILPGQLAFFIILSIFSIFPIIGLISSNFISTELVSNIEKTLPEGVYLILESLLDIKSSGSIIIFVVVAIYFASDGCLSMIITSNYIYKIPNNSFLKQKIKSILMTILLIVLILFIVIVPAFGEVIINAIKSYFPGRIIDTIGIIYSYLKIPLSFLLIFAVIKILYTIAPDKKIKSSFNNVGTLFTTVLWILITKAYSLYLSINNTYSLFYGAFANIIILFFWIYLLAYIYTLGLALNYTNYSDSKKVSNKEHNSQKENEKST